MPCCRRSPRSRTANRGGGWALVAPAFGRLPRPPRPRQRHHLLRPSGPARSPGCQKLAMHRPPRWHHRPWPPAAPAVVAWAPAEEGRARRPCGQSPSADLHLASGRETKIQHPARQNLDPARRGRLACGCRVGPYLCSRRRRRPAALGGGGGYPDPCGGPLRGAPASRRTSRRPACTSHTLLQHTSQVDGRPRQAWQGFVVYTRHQ
mmetsp:Transcript_62540/g.204077  ORF Transcript_62540/g.204077 Transcript_62540/m.204077 type:complete len:206 (-) Transcript_62540:1112-1729(-)